jgi:hypothetical protein
MPQRSGSRWCAKSTVAPEGTSETGRRDVGMFQHLMAFAARQNQLSSQDLLTDPNGTKIRLV